MWKLTIDRLFRPSPVLLLVIITGMQCTQPTKFPMLKTYKAMDAGAFLTFTKFKMGSNLPKFPDIMVSARAKQYSKKAPFSFRSLILNSRCSGQGRRPFSVPYHLPRHYFTLSQLFYRSPPHRLWLHVHRHI
jgi:hypothetical protein